MNQLKTTKAGLIRHLFLFSFLLALAGNTQALQLNNTQPISENAQINNEDSVYAATDKMPQFPGGEKALVQFLSRTISYPTEALEKNEQGKVIVQFVINKTGKVEKAKVLKGVSSSLDNEALRVVGLLPDWTPGEQNGKKVAVYTIIPVMFKTEAPKDSAEWQVTDKTLIIIDKVKMPVGFNVNILNLDKMASASVLKPIPEEEKSKLIKKYGKQAAEGVVLLTSKKDGVQYVLADSIKADCKEEATLAAFPGGEEKLLAYVADSIQYPFVAKRLNTQGKVIVQFLVDTTGKISNASIVRSVDYFLDKEALRVVSTMPDWIPGTICDQKISTYVTLPVEFKINNPGAKKEWVRNAKTIVMLNGERLPATFSLEWLNYSNLASYKVLEPGDKATNKKLTSEYGRDAVNGVVLISTTK